jgi:hypothetical protein
MTPIRGNRYGFIDAVKDVYRGAKKDLEWAYKSLSR